MEYYPQLFDMVETNAFGNKGRRNHIYEKYKAKEMTGAIKEKMDEYDAKVKWIARPLVISIIALFVFVLLLVLLVCIYLSALSESDSGIGLIFKRPQMWIPLAVLLVLTTGALVATLIFRKRAIIMNSELMAAEGISIIKNFNEYYSIPDEVTELSYFQYYYKGQKKTPRKQDTKVLNFAAFLRDGNVHIVHDRVLLKIPVRDCIGAEIVEGKIHCRDYVVHENRKQLYKDYGVKLIDNGVTQVKAFGRLMFQKDGELWTIDVMPYSFEPLKKLFSK